MLICIEMWLHWMNYKCSLTSFNKSRFTLPHFSATLCHLPLRIFLFLRRLWFAQDWSQERWGEGSFVLTEPPSESTLLSPSFLIKGKRKRRNFIFLQQQIEGSFAFCREILECNGRQGERRGEICNSTQATKRVYVGLSNKWTLSFNARDWTSFTDSQYQCSQNHSANIARDIHFLDGRHKPRTSINFGT